MISPSGTPWRQAPVFRLATFRRKIPESGPRRRISVIGESCKGGHICLDGGARVDSFVEMIRERALQRRQKLIEQLPVTSELLRGTLLNRIVRHKSGCPKCERGEGHAVSVLTVSYAGGRTQQFSVRRERVAEVQRWLNNYQKLKDAIEEICELNHELLRPDPTSPKPGRKRRD